MEMKHIKTFEQHTESMYDRIQRATRYEEEMKERAKNRPKRTKIKLGDTVCIFDVAESKRKRCDVYKEYRCISQSPVVCQQLIKQELIDETVTLTPEQIEKAYNPDYLFISSDDSWYIK
jgi:hypothetical protein